MHRFIAFSVIFSLFSLPLSGIANAWDRAAPADMLSLAAGSIVKIDVYGAPEDPNVADVNHGSGFVLTHDGFVETAAHLFSTSFHVQRIEGRLANVLSPDDNQANTFPLALVNTDPGRDVALLKFVGMPNGIRALPISSHTLQLGNTLYLFGFPGGQNTTTAYPGQFQSQLTPHRFQFQGIANVGNSGGPLIDEDGFVVGIDSHQENTILGSPITGTYTAAPAADFLLPPSFDPTQVRPLFFRTDNLNDPLVVASYPEWTSDAVTSALASYMSNQQPHACNMSLNPAWRLLKPETAIGFLIAPPPGSKLDAAQFQISLSVQQVPNYLRAVAQQIASHKYVPIPFNILPLEDESLLLLTQKNEPGQPVSKDIALELRVVDGDLKIVRYLPRNFGKYDYHPDNVDSEMAICTIKNKVPISLLLALCEPFMTQTISDYLTADNSCIPGTRVLH